MELNRIRAYDPANGSGGAMNKMKLPAHGVREDADGKSLVGVGEWFGRYLLDDLDRLSRNLRFVYAALIAALALALRIAILPPHPPFVFITLYPAVAIAAMLLGPWPGLLTCLLCIMGADYFLLPPAATLRIDPGHLAALLIFGAYGVFMCALTQGARLAARHNVQLAREHRAILESRLIGMIRVADRRITWANDAFADMFGYSRAELIGSSTRVLCASEADFTAWSERTHPVLEQGGIVRAEVRGVRKDGSLGWFEVSAGAIAKDVPEFVGTFVDITERKEAAERTAREGERMCRVFAAVAEGLIICDTRGDIIEANKSATAIVHMEREAILGLNLRDPRWQCTRDDGSPLPTESLAGVETLRTGQAVLNQMYGLTIGTGEQRWVSSNSQPINGPDGAIEAVVISCSDVTDLRVLHEELRRSQIDLAAVLDNVPAQITCWNRDYTNQFANRSALRDIASESAVITGRRMPEVMGEERFAQKKPFLDAALAGESRVQELVLKRADGKTQYHQVSYVPKVLDGAVTGVYVLAVDITPLHESFERIRDLAQTLETVREEERRAISISLHEGIAQELFATKLSLEHLATQTRGRKGATAACEELSEAIRRCMDSTRQLANDLRPEGLERLGLAPVLRQHADHFGRRAKLVIQMTEQGTLPALDEAAKLVLFRAAQEILTNVAKHAHARKVRIELGPERDGIALCIQDDGVGITADALRKSGSLGLLGIRDRLQTLGGCMNVENVEPSGTRVRLFMPANPAMRSFAVSPSSDEAPGHSVH
jgi:PAS domain S-box-containing protein